MNTLFSFREQHLQYGYCRTCRAAVITSIYQHHFPETEKIIRTECGDRETEFVKSENSTRLEEVVHKGDDNTFKVPEDDVEIRNEDANKRKR